MAYPHIATDSSTVIKVFKRGWDYITGGTSSKEEIYIQDYDSMQSEALQLYMETYEHQLCQFQFSSIKSATEEIMKIFHSLRSVLTRTDRGRYDSHVSSELTKVCMVAVLS